MVKIVSPYANTGGNDLGKGIAQLGAALFGDTATPEYKRQRILDLSLGNQGRLDAAAAFDNLRPDGSVDPVALARAAALAGDGGKGWENYRGYAANAFGAGDERATNAFVGAGGAFGSTAQGYREGQATEIQKAQIVADRAAKAEEWKAANTPISVIDPTTGQPYTTSRSIAISQGLTPVLSQADAKGAAAQGVIARGGGDVNAVAALSPEAREFVGAYIAPKNPDVYSSPNGPVVYDSGTNGLVYAQTRQPIPQAETVGRLTVNDPNSLRSTKKQEDDILQGRIAVRTMTEGINNLIADLKKPDADQTIGFVGRAANVLNGFRVQAEAAARAFGGESFGQAAQNPELTQAVSQSVAKYANANPQAVAKLQSLGIDNARIQSQIMDLAYTLAKAYDPGGRMSNQDVERATQIIMGSVMDPNAGIAVLTDVRSRMERNFQIREEETFAAYPQLRERFGGALPQGTPSPNAAPAAPGAAAPRQAPPANFDPYTKFGLQPPAGAR